MNARKTRTPFFAAVLFLLAMGMVSPLLIAGQSATIAPTQAQLSDLISAAGVSRSYANSMVEYASASGLSVASAQAQLSQGDTLLAAAGADGQSGSITAGIQSVRAAMDYYTSAATEVSVEISNAGLVASIDFSLVEQEISDVNATASVMAAVALSACAQAGGSSGGTGALAQACSQLDAQLSDADASLRQASAIAVQSDGQANASLGFAQAISLASSARTELNSTQSELVIVAAQGYGQRAQSYVSSVIQPLSAQANATIAAEETVNSSLSSFQQAYSSYISSENASASTILNSGAALGSAITGVDTASVNSDVSLGDSVASQVSTDMTAILGLPGVSAFTNLVADANTCLTATSAFEQSAGASGTASSSFPQTGFTGFTSYASTMNQAQANVQSSGASYVAAYQKVLADLYGALSLAGASAIYADLSGLQVSATVSALNGSLVQETSGLAAVQTDIGTYTGAVTAQGPIILVPSAFSGSATTVSTQAESYLNASESAAVSQIPSSVQATSQAAEAFDTSANSSARATVGGFASSLAALKTDASALSTRAGATGAEIGDASAALRAGIQSRVNDASDARLNVSAALGLFSSAEIVQGTAAMVQASLELQAAATVNGSVA